MGSHYDVSFTYDMMYTMWFVLKVNKSIPAGYRKSWTVSNRMCSVFIALSIMFEVSNRPSSEPHSFTRTLVFLHDSI